MVSFLVTIKELVYLHLVPGLDVEIFVVLVLLVQFASGIAGSAVALCMILILNFCVIFKRSAREFLKHMQIDGLCVFTRINGFDFLEAT